MILLKSNRKEINTASRLLLVSKCIMKMVDFIYGAVYIVLMNSKGLSELDISFVFAISTMFLFVFDFPTGVISDKFGRKKIASIGLIIWGISFLFFIKANNLLGFILAEAILQIGIALVSGNFQSWFYDLSKKYDQIEFKNKFLLKLGVIVQLFSIIGSLIGSLILVIRVSVLYIFCSIMMIGLGIICYFVSEDNHSCMSDNKNIFDHLISTTKEFICNPLTRRLIPYEFLNTFTMYAFILGWQLYYLNTLKMPEGYIGMLLVWFMISMLIGKKICEILYKKFSVNTIIISSFGCMMFGFLLMCCFKNIYGLIISATIIEIGMGIYNNIEEIWIFDMIPSENISSFYSGINTLAEIFIFILSLSIGLIIQYIGTSFLWGLVTVMILLNIIYYVFLISKKSCKVS